jgi:integrase
MEKFELHLGQTSANDDDGFAANRRERSVPIPETMTRIAGYPSKLVVYQIQASRFWQARSWIGGQLRKRSTKQTDVKQAQQVAKVFFQEWLISAAMQRNLRSMSQDQLHTLQAKTMTSLEAKPAHKNAVNPTFGTLAKQLLLNETARVNRGESSKAGLMVLRNRLQYVSSDWGEIPCADIGYQQLQDLVNQLSLEYSTTTIHQYLVAIRKVLRHALAMRLIEVLPEFPKIRISPQSRGAFTPSEYWKILRSARRLIGQSYPDSSRAIRLKNNIRRIDKNMPPDLAWAAGFMVNAFIRPSDLRTLRHKHIEVVHGVNTYLRMTLPQTKSHGKPIVTLFPAVRIYQRIVEHQSALGKAGPEDFLFLPHIRDRDYALRVLGFHLNWILQKTGLKSGPHGQPRSLYSFRHSAITFRLLYGQGIDLITLARNARTSIEVINTHYASTVTGEQNIAMLQSRRTKMHLSVP